MVVVLVMLFLALAVGTAICRQRHRRLVERTTAMLRKLLVALRAWDQTTEQLTAEGTPLPTQVAGFRKFMLGLVEEELRSIGGKG